MPLTDRLHAAGIRAGLTAIGFAETTPFLQVREAMVRRIESGRSAGMGFTFTDPTRATTVTDSFPWARSLVVAAHGYLPEAGSPGPARPGTGRVARFATGDHYAPLIRALGVMEGLLSEGGHRTGVVVDDARLVDRAAAVRSGVAWWGKSTMALAPGVGPWFLIGSIATDAELSPSSPMQRSCGECVACIPACPTGALDEAGVLDARRCLSHLGQAPGSIPVEFRQAMGDRLYGCDECLTACPPGSRALEEATAERGRIDLVEVLASADRPLRSRFGHFYVPRNQVRHLRRNALVALGNGGDRGMVGVVAGYVGHPDPLLRLHAAWALGRLGGPLARAALRAAMAAERDPEVCAELQAAVEAAGGSLD